MLVLLVGATKILAVKVGICSDPGPNVIKKITFLIYECSMKASVCSWQNFSLMFVCKAKSLP